MRDLSAGFLNTGSVAGLFEAPSLGYADAKGVAGADAGDTVLLEGIYSNIPVYVEVPQVGTVSV